MLKKSTIQICSHFLSPSLDGSRDCLFLVVTRVWAGGQLFLLQGSHPPQAERADWGWEKWLENCYLGPHTQHCWKEPWFANKDFMAMTLSRLKTAPFCLHSKLRPFFFFFWQNSEPLWMTVILLKQPNPDFCLYQHRTCLTPVCPSGHTGQITDRH